MGEKIRDLAEIRMGGADLMIELNHSVSQNYKYDIHVQNEKFRMEFTDKDFLQIASNILLAKRNFENLKEGKS